MTRRTVEIVESNISSEPAEVEVIYSVQGTQYRMDLTEAEAKGFYDMINPYVSVSEIMPVRRGGARKRQHTVGEVREWAIGQGIELNLTGRIPNEIWDQFEVWQAKPKAKSKRS